MKSFKKILPALLYGCLLFVIIILTFIVSTEKKTTPSVAEDTDFYSFLDADNKDNPSENPSSDEQTSENQTSDEQKSDEQASDEQASEKQTSEKESTSPKESVANEKEVKSGEKQAEENTQQKEHDEEKEDTSVHTAAKEEYNDTVPRSHDENGKQKIYGDGTFKLCDALVSPLGIYVFVRANSKNGDISGDEPLLGVLLSDTDCNITAKFVLHEKASNFVCAQLTETGIVFITENEEKTYYYIHILSFDFRSVSTYKIAYAKAAKIVPTEGSFLVFCSYSNECLLYSFTNGRFVFQSLDTGSLVEIFEKDNTYRLFLQGKNSYSSVLLAKNTLQILDKKSYPNTLLYVFPYYENGEKIITIEENNGIYAYKRSEDTVEAERKLGNFKTEGASLSADGILLLCRGDICGTVQLTFDLVGDFVEVDAEVSAAEFLDFCQYPYLLVLCSDSNGNMFILTETKERIAIGQEKGRGFLLPLPDRKCFCVWQESDSVIRLSCLSLPSDEREEPQTPDSISE